MAESSDQRGSRESRETPPSRPERTGDPRSGDRRGGDRRRTDRRAPPPVWRRPWALVGYGALAALVLVVALRGNGGDEEEEEPQAEILAEGTPPPSGSSDAVVLGAPVEVAMQGSDYERLLIEGDQARGRLIRVLLFCAPVSSTSIREVDNPERRVVALGDSDRRVPTADCKWGEAGGDRRPDLVLLVPPGLAESFAAQPVVTDGFIRRRRLVADVEWVGRSESLSLRTASILRRVVEGSP